MYKHSIKVHTQEAQILHQLTSDPNLLIKSTSKCECCETKFTKIKTAFENFMNLGLKGGISISVRPKFGFGIGNQNQGPISVSVSEPKLFFSKPNFFFQILLIFSTSWGNTSFYKLENKPSPSKII